MRMISREKERNRGFSLIELIVAILIMSVVMAMVVMLISSSRVTYSSVKTNAVLQGEADIVRNFIGEIAVEARNWGQKSYTDGSDTYPFIWFKAPDNDAVGVNRNYFYYVFLLKGDKLRYGKFRESDALNNVSDGNIFGAGFSFPASGDVYGNNILTDPYSVLAEHLSQAGDGIYCNESIILENGKYISAPLVTVRIRLSYNDHDYEATMNYAARNNNGTLAVAP